MGNASIPATRSSTRVRGIDSIRFLCAVVVMLGHIGFLHSEPHGVGKPALIKMLIGIYNSLFNGHAAVIVFFVISGFCIHYPFRSGRSPILTSFYSRRYLRVLGPALVFYAGMRWIGKDLHSPFDMVLWSVICEVIYYTLYPALLLLRQRCSWGLLIAISTTVAIMLFLYRLQYLTHGADSYTVLRWGTWVIGLPCWLLGCWLAEQYTSFRVCTSHQIWLVRTAIYVLSVLIELLHFHTPLPPASNVFMLNFFAFAVTAWLGLEIQYAHNHEPSRFLEWAGTWSYSLYLGHVLGPTLLAGTFVALIYAKPSTHFIKLFVALAFSYGFYRLVEYPSHRLAIFVSRNFDRKKTEPSNLLAKNA